MFHNILVAVDASADADAALMHAIHLAVSGHTRLTLITTVGEPPLTAYLMGHAATGLLRNHAHGQAETVIRRARNLVPADLAVSTVFSKQPIRLALMRQLKEADHDLVVTGSRGVSHYVLNHCPIPVLVVHAEQSTLRALSTA
jgi:nucleotide-binding universal stress UspA family protein